MLAHGEERYERSSASGGRKDDEFIPLISDIRTSWTTWCDNATCTEDPVMLRIAQRVADVTQVTPLHTAPPVSPVAQVTPLHTAPHSLHLCHP